MQTAELLHELAEAGSIEALLERHPQLTRGDVEAALDRAAFLAASEDRLREPLSPVYRAYNGFMLGMYAGGFMFFEARDEKEEQERAARRISEFLLELGNELASEIELDGAGTDMEGAIDTVVRELDSDLADYYQLGLAAFRFMIARIAGSDPAESIEEGQQLLRSLGHPPILFHDVLDAASVPSEDEDKGRRWRDLMTASLMLTRELLLGLAEEPESCFVALPFKDPYEERFLNLYRGVARRMNKRAIRAWGALAGEDHQELLMVLISRCGALLAEVTEPNANVTLEVGFALGQNKNLYLVAEGEKWRRTSNIQLHWVYPYIPAGEEWELEAAEKAGLYFTTLEASRRPGPIPSWRFKPLDLLSRLTEAMARPPGDEDRT